MNGSPSAPGSIGKGFGLWTAGCGALFVLLVFTPGIQPRSFGTDGLALFAFFGIGIAQLVYVVPLLIWTRSKGERSTFKGIVIAASVTFLLNAACFGVLFTA